MMNLEAQVFGIILVLLECIAYQALLVELDILFLMEKQDLQYFVQKVHLDHKLKEHH